MAKSQTKKGQTQAAANGAHQASGQEESLPCYALSLTVENVRCFGPKQELKLTNKEGKLAQWTIILGENGTGKTTLLQALVCFEYKQSSFEGRDKTHSWTRLNDFLGKNTEDCVTTFDSCGLRRDSGDNCEARCTANFGMIRDLARSSSTPGPTFQLYWVIRHLGNEYSTGIQSPFFGYGAGRRLGILGLSQAKDTDPAGTLFDENALLRNAEEWLLQLDYAASKEPDGEIKQKLQLERVKSLLISILTEDVKDIRFKTTGGVYPKARVEFQTFSGWVPLRRLGNGYQTLIAWVTDFASRMMERYPDSSDPFKEAAIVLIDEIDLHLHPLWQRKLIADLTKHFPNTQFIATAHSPLVVQAAENANITLLKRVGDHVEIINNPEEIRGWRIDQILTSGLFGLQSARSPEVEALFQRKQELGTKTKKTAREKAELREIQLKIDKLPVGDSPQAAKEMDTIREAIDFLKDQLPK